MLKSDLCNFSDAYVVMEETVIVAKKTFVANDFMDLAENRRAASATICNTTNDEAPDWRVAFKNNAPFINCISKINGVLIDKTEDLDVIMRIYNFLRYSKNYRKKATKSLWNNYRDEPNSGAEGNINYSLKESKSLDYQASIVGSVTAANLTKEPIKIVIPLKHLGNF